MNHLLKLVVHDRIASYTDLVSPDTFRYAPERGWRVLQQFCFWILRRLDCQAVDKHVSYSTIVVDQTNIPHTALDQINRIKRRGGEPDFILMGPSVEHQFQQSFGPYEYTAYYNEGNSFRRQVYGVNVRVVPGFEGCVVVPKI